MEVSEKSKHAGLREASDRATQIIADAIANGQRPELEIGDNDTQRLFISAWATFHGLATLTVNGQLSELVGAGADMEALGNCVTDVIYRGLY